MHGFAQDLRFALRTFRKNPEFTAVAIITLALGIGANTAIFSVVNGILLSPLPFPDADRLVRVWELNGRGGTLMGAWRNFADWRESAESFEGLVAHGSGGISTVLGTGSPLRVGVTAVSQGFFRTMGVQPVRGRGFTPEEHRFGADPAVVVSDGFWRTHLGADPDVDSRRLGVSGFDARIVGVMPPGFDYPGDIDIWYPLELREQTESRTAHNYALTGRLQNGVPIAAADAELDAITAGFLAEEPGVTEETWFEGFFPRSARVVPLREYLVGDTRRPLWILFGASGLLLLIACTNLASATLARGTHRERELAVRRSLGADRGRVVRQLFTESLGLACGGAIIGIGAAAVAMEALPALAPAALPRMGEVGLDGTVLAFTAVVSIGTAVLFGLLPGIRTADDDLALTLRAGSRGTSPARRLAWRWLVASEVALALLLLVGSGLLIRSFWKVLQVQPGFRTEGLLTATFNPPGIKYPDGEARLPYYQELLGELESIRGISDVGLIARPPLTRVSNGMVDVSGGLREAVTGDYQLATAGYFRAMEIPLIRGRVFDDRDHAGAEHAVVVNEAFAELAWPGMDPIGKRITGGGMDDYWDQEKWATVIGVVGNVRQRDLVRSPEPTYYFRLGQRPYRSWSMTATIRPADTDVGALVPVVREVVASVDPDVPVTFATIESRLSRRLADRRFTVLVLGLFAAVAVVLACVGIYGVVAYTVARRTREIGIRIALGAAPISVRRLVQRDTLIAAILGGTTGLLLAATLTRVMESLLYEISPLDPLTFLAVAGTLGGAAWTASWIPALRSTRTDPTLTMRVE